jgi:hypothetical protein
MADEEAATQTVGTSTSVSDVKASPGKSEAGDSTETHTPTDDDASPRPPEEQRQPKPSASAGSTSRKTAPARKTTKITAAQKPAGKKPASRKPASRQARITAQQAKFPRHPVEKSLRIAKAIFDQNAGKATTVADAAKFTTGGKAGGPFAVEVSSGKKYGFLRSEAGKLIPEDRARKVLFPQSETDRLTALREAVLGAPDMAEVYSHYRGENLPDTEFFTNALRDTFKVPAEKIPEFLDVFFESMRSAQLLDESGERPRLIDVGRSDTVKPVAVPGPTKANVASNATCFVMQPFGGPRNILRSIVQAGNRKGRSNPCKGR